MTSSSGNSSTVILATALGSACACGAYLCWLSQQQRREQKKAQLDAPSNLSHMLTIGTNANPNAGDINAHFQVGLPLLIPSGCRPLDPEMLRAHKIIFSVPAKKLEAVGLPKSVGVAPLLDNLKEEADQAATLNDLAFFHSDSALATRFTRYKRTPLYGMISTSKFCECTKVLVDDTVRGVSRKFLNAWPKRRSYLWLGASTGSLHYDEHDNFLCQLAGRKKMILFGIEHTMCFKMGSISSQFPNHSSLNSAFMQEANRQLIPRYEVVLNPGDVLLIPAGMLHAPAGDLNSLSVNIFGMEGPAPSERSALLLRRMEWSTQMRACLCLPLAHHDYSIRTQEEMDGSGDDENVGEKTTGGGGGGAGAGSSRCEPVASAEPQ
jgi:hypothetical protein